MKANFLSIRILESYQPLPWRCFRSIYAFIECKGHQTQNPSNCWDFAFLVCAIAFIRLFPLSFMPSLCVPHQIICLCLHTSLKSSKSFSLSPQNRNIICVIALYLVPFICRFHCDASTMLLQRQIQKRKQIRNNCFDFERVKSVMLGMVCKWCTYLFYF